MSAKGHLQTCSDGKSLVCFYHESGPNRSRVGGCTERNCFPYRRMVRLEPAALLARKWRFQGGFPYTPIHGQIRTTPPPPFPRDARAEGLGDEEPVGGPVIEPDTCPPSTAASGGRGVAFSSLPVASASSSAVTTLNSLHPISVPIKSLSR